MKKLITLLTVIFAGTILFSSCKNNMSIAKRHYRNGYYIAKSSHNAEARYNENKVKENYATLTPKQRFMEYDRSAQAAQAPMAMKERKDNNFAPKENKVAKQKYSLVPSAKIPTTILERKKAERATLKPAPAASDDALSLFWIVILVLLILFVLGLLGGIGGGLVYILLVVALILLILWLLRIL